MASGPASYTWVMNLASSESAPRSIEVAQAEAGQRLDRFLSGRLGASRTQIRRLLARGGVVQGGRPLGLGDKGAPVKRGDQLEISDYRPPEQRRNLAEPAVALDVLAEGPGWLAVDKPSGVPVHPLEEGETGSLLSAVAARYPALHGVGEAGLRSGVVHRLDVDTSGVVLVATSQASWQRLRAAFAEHRVLKVYRAVVRGRVTRAQSLRLGLRVAQHRPARVRVVPVAQAEADPAVWAAELALRPLEPLNGATLVEVVPRTGFLHQIRASLAHLGHPLLGDRRYGARTVDGGDGDPMVAPRHLLHAARLRFEEIEASSPDPEDFRRALTALRS